MRRGDVCAAEGAGRVVESQQVDPPARPRTTHRSHGRGKAVVCARCVATHRDHLFRTVRPRDREFSYEEVATAVREAGGPTISGTYIAMLRKGVRDNPTLRHLEALARFFGVQAAYFHDDEVTRRIDSELELLVALRDAGVKSIALRAAGLSPEGLAAIPRDG